MCEERFCSVAGDQRPRTQIGITPETWDAIETRVKVSVFKDLAKII